MIRPSVRVGAAIDRSLLANNESATLIKIKRSVVFSKSHFTIGIHDTTFRK
jgi:hypothetical protein